MKQKKAAPPFYGKEKGKKSYPPESLSKFKGNYESGFKVWEEKIPDFDCEIPQWEAPSIDWENDCSAWEESLPDFDFDCSAWEE